MESSFVAQPNDMSCIRSFSTLISLIQSNPEELTQQFSSQPEVDPASVQRKRRVRQPAEYLTEEDKRERKNARDKRYRERVKVEMNKAKEDLERMKPEYDRVMKIASECGGIDEMETQFRRLQQMVSKYGGFEEIEWKMNKLEQIEAESSIFEKVKTMFGGIDNIVPGLDRLKKTEFQHTVSKPNQNERPSYIDFIPTSPEILQDDYNHEGQNSANLSNQGSSCEISDWLGEYGISQMFLVADTLYSDLVVTKFIAKLESNTKSSVNFSSFKELEGERQTIGDYCFPKSLVSTFEAIMNAHGDVARNSHFGPRLIEDAYVLFCAAIKEMDDLPLHQVTEETVFKWRDAIKDAMRVGCDVEFAWKHLETIAYAYFGLKARNDRKGLEQSIAKLTQVEKSLRQELEMKVNEVKVLKAKEEELSSPQCNKCQEIADCFQNKTVGLFRS